MELSAIAHDLTVESILLHDILLEISKYLSTWT